MRELPIGSTLDSENGVFSWQPGPGFIGKYSFEFVENDNNGVSTRRTVDVTIVPRFK